MSVTHWRMGPEGWTFDEGPGAVPDPILGARCVHEIYKAASPCYTGRVTVPILWDKRTATIVSNESADIVRMMNSAFDGVGATVGDYYPEPLRPHIDRINSEIYERVNNGVYKAGFATTQAAYEEAVESLVRDPRSSRNSARPAAISLRLQHHGGGLAAFRHARALRSSLRRPLQVQYPTPFRISQFVGLHARALPVARGARDGQFRTHQTALL